MLSGLYTVIVTFAKISFMNPIISKLLPGLLPLIVFIAADEFFGPVIGIAVALGFGLVQLLYMRIRQKVWDRFVLIDTALLLMLGAVSLSLEDEKLFLWKPVLMDVLLMGFLLFSLLSRKNLVLLMSKRYMGDMQLDDTQKKFFNRNLWAFLLVSFLHALATVYAIYFLTKEAWLFIGGTLLYIMMGVYLVVMFLVQKLSKKRSSAEYVPVVDEEGKIVERVSRAEVHNGSKKLHPVVHLHVVRHDGAFLLQLRPNDKQVQPGKWDTAVGGHVSWGESIEKALQRETREEIGLKQYKPLFSQKYIWNSDIESELVFVFVYRSLETDKFTHTQEVTELRWWTIPMIKRNLGKGVFTPNFEHEFAMLVKI